MAHPTGNFRPTRVSGSTAPSGLSASERNTTAGLPGTMPYAMSWAAEPSARPKSIALSLKERADGVRGNRWSASRPPAWILQAVVHVDEPQGYRDALPHLRGLRRADRRHAARASAPPPQNPQ